MTDQYPARVKPLSLREGLPRLSGKGFGVRANPSRSTFLLLNLAIDLLYALIDPRIALAHHD